MPLNKSQCKSSNETLDSTLDSRMSSTEIPQMEILKVNYVQQCKEARIPRMTIPAKQSQQKRHGFIAASTKYPDYNQTVKANHTQLVNAKTGAVGALKMHDTNLQRAAPSKIRTPQPLPPPTIESWNFLQHQLPKTNSQIKQEQQSDCLGAASRYRTSAATSTSTSAADTTTKGYAEAQSCCSSACSPVTQSSCYSNKGDDYVAHTTKMLYNDCEKSNSWNYRTRISTCDIRRDMARIKSRADRIANIEQTDCAHQQRQQQPLKEQRGGANSADIGLKRLSLPLQNSNIQKPEVVTQINRLFEQVKQPEQRRSIKQYRAPAPPRLPIATLTDIKTNINTTALPTKQPPTCIKEPNVEIVSDSFPCIDERVKRFSNSSGSVDCIECVVESKSDNKEKSRVILDQQRIPQSRIPKPINEATQQQIHSSSSVHMHSEANEQLHRRIRQMFNNEEERKQELQRQITAEFRAQLRTTKSTATEVARAPMLSTEKQTTNSNDQDSEHFLKTTRLQASGNFQKLKTDRVHIRKKRQPLLIINQLNESKASNNVQVKGEKKDGCDDAIQKVSKQMTHNSPSNGNRRTCGYKNCNFTNCPMSAISNSASCNSSSSSNGNSKASTPQLSDEDLHTGADKRLSLESCCSDSGISSSAELKEHNTKDNNVKNLGKCVDCVKILLIQGHTEPTVMPKKLKEFASDEVRVGKVSGMGSGDPNDVQNFAKKNLVKATTDELLIAAAAKNNITNNNSSKKGVCDKLPNRTAAAAAAAEASVSNGKKCNIANDLKNKEQRIYNNTNNISLNSIDNNNKIVCKPSCATTIKIDDTWVREEQSVCDADSLMASPKSPPPPISLPARHYFNNTNNINSRHSYSPSGDSDKHSVKIFVRSSTRSTGVGGNPARASSISMNSYTSQTSGCSTNSAMSALSNASKSSTSGSSYTTISSSGTSSSNGHCQCRCGRNVSTVARNKENDVNEEEDDDDDEFGAACAGYFGSLDRMVKSGIYFNSAAILDGNNDDTQNDTLRLCSCSPTPSADTFCEISCVECGDVEHNEHDAKARSSQSSFSSSGIGGSGCGPIGGIFWNDTYFLNERESLRKPSAVANQNSATLAPINTVDQSKERISADNEQCCCSLTSCEDDNCSFYEIDSAVDMDNRSTCEPHPDDNHCVSRIEVHASVHIPNTNSANSDADDIENQGRTNNCDDCECDELTLNCNENKNSVQKCAIAMKTELQQHIRERERCATCQQQQKEQQWLRQRIRDRNCGRQMQFIRNSSAEEILIRNQNLLRKADVIPELRPRSMDGVFDSSSALLNGVNTGLIGDISNHPQNQQDAEVRRIHRGHVLTELLETERIYVNEMASILKGYRDQMLSEEMMHLVPASLQGKEDVLFGNLHELFTFHNDVFLKDLENCISTTELVALCFVQRRDTFYRLYSFYCQNIPRSDRLRETLVDTHLFLQECQKRLGHKLPLGAYLLKPVQRITKYKLLLENLLGSSDSGSCTKELQKALDCMLIVLRCVNDSMHQVAITGFPSNLSQQGELLLQDPFQVWTESKKDLRLRKKPQQRHIFLYQKSMIFCKKTSKPGHNKSTYQFKHQLKMSQIGLTESVRGDLTRFEVWLQGRQEVHTLQATSEDVKNKWVTEIKRLLLNQLEELKGEKIKQYSMNHHGLRQTTSWDTPNILLGMTQRAVSCDASSESSNRNSNCSSSGDDAYTHGIPQSTTSGIGSGLGGGGVIGVGADKDQQEACGWSSDYSNSEDEMSIIEDNSAPRFMNFLSQWSYNGDNNGSGGGGGGSYPRTNKSNSKFYVSVEH